MRSCSALSSVGLAAMLLMAHVFVYRVAGTRVAREDGDFSSSEERACRAREDIDKCKAFAKEMESPENGKCTVSRDRRDLQSYKSKKATAVAVCTIRVDDYKERNVNEGTQVALNWDEVIDVDEDYNIGEEGVQELSEDHKTKPTLDDFRKAFNIISQKYAGPEISFNSEALNEENVDDVGINDDGSVNLEDIEEYFTPLFEIVATTRTYKSQKLTAFKEAHRREVPWGYGLNVQYSSLFNPKEYAKGTPEYVRIPFGYWV